MPIENENNQGGVEDNSATEIDAATATVEDILNFDPFGPEESAGLNANGSSVATVEEDNGAVTNEDGSQVNTGLEGVTQEQLEDATTQPSTEQPSTSPSEDPEKILIQKQLEEANAALKQMKEHNEQRQAQAQNVNSDQGQPEDDTPQYVFNIPDQLIGMINSEDPSEAKQGLTALIAGVSRTVHKQVLDQVQQNIAPQILQMAVQQQSQNVQRTEEQNNIRMDFYGRYKEFNHDALRPYISQTAVALASELGIKNYTPEFGDVLAQRVKAALSQFQPATTNPPINTPPKINQGSVTRSPAPKVSSQQDEMMELINLN